MTETKKDIRNLQRPTRSKVVLRVLRMTRLRIKKQNKVQRNGYVRTQKSPLSHHLLLHARNSF